MKIEQWAKAKLLEDKMSETEKDAITLRIEWAEENKYEAF